MGLGDSGEGLESLQNSRLIRKPQVWTPPNEAPRRPAIRPSLPGQTLITFPTTSTSRIQTTTRTEPFLSKLGSLIFGVRVFVIRV